jgi:PAS domain S-box-containing protein
MVNALKTKKELMQELETALKRLSEAEQLKKALQQSEERFSIIFANNPIALSITRLRDNVIIDINDAYIRVSGYTREEIIGRMTAEMGIWVNPGEREQILNAVKEKGRISGEEFHFRNKSGKVHPVLLSAETIQIAGEDCLLVMTIDMSRYKEAEDALRFSDAAFKSIHESIIAVDLKNIITYWNESSEELFGIKASEAIGKNLFNIIKLKESPSGHARELSQKLMKQGYNRDEMLFRTPRGEVWTDTTAKVMEKDNQRYGYIITALDITDRKNAKKALQDSEEKFSKAFNASTSAICIVTLKDNRFIEINASFTRYTGYTYKDVIGRTATDLNLWVKPEELKKWQETIQKKGRIFNQEFSSRMKSGEIRIGLGSAEVINLLGEPCRIVVITDITERKKTENALKMSEENFRHSLDDSPLGILILDSDDDTIYANRALLEIFGYDNIEEFRTIPVKARYTPESYAEYLIRKDKRDRGEEVPVPVVISIIRKDGEIRYLATVRKEVLWSGKRQYQIIYRDITERKKAEEALRDSEEKFSKAFNSGANAICISSLADNKFSEINEAYTRFTGYTREEIIGHTAAELDIWVMDEEYQKLVAMLTRDGTFRNMEFHSRMKSGEIRTGLGSAENVVIGGKQCRIVVITDITERKKAEEALQESEERFRTIFEQASDSIVLIDPKTLKIVDFNTHAYKTLGYTREEFAKLDIGDTNIFEPIEEIQKRAEVFFKGNASTLETKQKTKSGKMSDVQISLKTINLGGKKLVMSIWRDITESKRAQEALTESEEKFSKIFHASPNPFCIASIEGETFIDINESYSRYTGYTREETIGRTSEELGLWVNEDDVKTMRSILMQKGRILNHQFATRMKSGELRTVLFSAEIITIAGRRCIIIAITDITERKKVEDALKMSEENFRHSLDDSPLGIRIVNSTGEPIYINQTLLEIYGYSTLEEYQSRPVEKRFTPDMYQEHLKVLQEMANHEVVPKIGETSIVRKDGEIRHLVVLTKEILWNSEKQYQLLYIDISERKKADEKLKEAMANMEQSSARLAAANKELEVFSYSVSHDLRSPLRSIDGFSQALLEDYADKLDDTGKDYLKRLRNASQKMGELIDGLLRLSRLSRSELHRMTLDLSTMAVEIIARLRETQPERKVEFIVGEDLVAEADPQLCRALLENLLGNAWKFTGKVPHPVIELGSIKSGAQKTFFVRDNGAGFDMTYVDKLFGAFQRLHDNADFPGTGIGLATVQRIVNRHGGRVRAEGETGKGATFYFTFG